jgi:aldehyde:ferredoxin oxidoreductase
MVKGFAGEIVRVNLSTGKIKKEKINEQWARLFIGGRGYGSKIIYDEVDPKIDPLAPENKVVIATGSTCGSNAPTSGRVMVITKGPETGTIACSNVGGHFGPQLKRAGYDMVIIEGKSDKPVYLWINDGNIEIRDARKLWGKKTSETEEAIKRETDPQARVMNIGPAGVKLSRIANVMVDACRAAGRSGVGAVLGSKNLLGIAARGTGKVEPFDPAETKTVAAQARKLLKDSEITSVNLPKYGTAIMVNEINERGGYPVRNAQEAYDADAGVTGGEEIADKILIKKWACAACPIACGRVTEIKEGKYKGHHGEGPEYETTWALGLMCGVHDLNAITYAHYLCNDYGLDGISAGVTIACAMELYEKGYIPKEEAPFPIRFGDGDTVVKLVPIMGERKGIIGDLLAEGSYRLAEHYGHPELSMSVKKQEMPAYDPRAMKGIGLNYATSNRGACHVRGYTISQEVIESPYVVDRLIYVGKAELTKYMQDLTAVIDSAGMCLFTVFGLEYIYNYGPILRAVTGLPYSDEELMKAGERIWNLERLFNLKAGFTGKDDTLPTRLLEEPIPSGPSQGEVCQLDRMLAEYYRLRGWDEDGVPTKEKLEELGLKEVALPEKELRFAR